VRERERKRGNTRWEIEKGKDKKSRKKGRGRKVLGRRRLSSPEKTGPTSSLLQATSLQHYGCAEFFFFFFVKKLFYVKINVTI
jgi:hypothetical protein